jgi:hypothetical protein
MKHVFIIPVDQDIQDVIKSQALKFIDEKDLVFLAPDINKSHKETLQALQDVDLGECLIFNPPWTVLLEAPNFKALEVVAGEMISRNLSYVRLRKIGRSSFTKIEGSDNLCPDAGGSFFLTPHIWKTSEFHEWINSSRDKNMLYWESLEVGKIDGAFFHRASDQPSMKITYWRCGIYNAVSDIITGSLWSDTYLDFNGKPLRSILSDLEIDPETRGIGSVGGCCYDMG